MWGKSHEGEPDTDSDGNRKITARDDEQPSECTPKARVEDPFQPTSVT